jgi:hypothetical protein
MRQLIRQTVLEISFTSTSRLLLLLAVVFPPFLHARILSDSQFPNVGRGNSRSWDSCLGFGGFRYLAFYFQIVILPILETLRKISGQEKFLK